VNGGAFRPEENKALPSELDPVPELGLEADDLLISRANTRELVGSAAVVDRDHANLLLCDKLYRLRFHRGSCTPWFIAYYLASPGVRGQIELQATGASSSMVNIGQSTILELTIALPGRSEQESITAFIRQACLQLDALTANAQSAITLLQERRSALISAAVTGKIDVRGLAPQQEAVAA
jgi:type I restriction enzyme S subunit